MGERRGAYGVWVWKPDGKRKLGRPRRRREDDIKMGFMKWMGMNWIDLAQDREGWRLLVNAEMKIRFP